MRIAHIADLHLGYKQFTAVDSNGINQREVDVAQTFDRLIDALIVERPDCIVIAGDIFHFVRPSNYSIVVASRGFRRLAQALPGIPVIMVAGNHDAPRSADGGSILNVFKELLGFTVVAQQPERFAVTVAGQQLEVLAVPDVYGVVRPEMRPQLGLQHSLLLLHGEVQGAIPDHFSDKDLPVGSLYTFEWSYVALGHYHVYTEVAADTYYCGSIDYTSSDMWKELQTGKQKGFVIHDLSQKTHDFIPLPPSRKILSYSIDAADLTASEMDAAIERTIFRSGDIAGAVIRIVFDNCAKHRLRELNRVKLDHYRSQLLYLQLDNRQPELAQAVVSVEEQNRHTIEEIARLHFEGWGISPDISRERFVSSGLQYLKQAKAMVSDQVVQEVTV